MSTEEVKEKFEEILSNNRFLKSDLPDFFTAASEIIDFMADQMEEHEPYATISIGKYREVARTFWDVEDAIHDFTYDKDSESDD
jgi:hypothetical protein